MNAVDWFAEFLVAGRERKFVYACDAPARHTDLRSFPIAIGPAPMFDISDFADDCTDADWDALVTEGMQRLEADELHLPFPLFYMIEVRDMTAPDGRQTQMVLINRIADTEQGIRIERFEHSPPPPTLPAKYAIWLAQPVAVFLGRPAMASINAPCSAEAIEKATHHMAVAGGAALAALTLLVQPNVVREVGDRPTSRMQRKALRPGTPFPPVRRIEVKGWHYLPRDRDIDPSGREVVPHDRRGHPRVYHRGTENEYTIQVPAAKVKGGGEAAQFYLVTKRPRR
jgi:hypothetical protein